ncbi:hypothetical protein QJS10_CPA06g00820 [Acorus calamus]|uniref:Non-haem dioxygenase N-terminal domain-containing protein n=1 Tax=Acorus calamus TaxID=4465 RepID=A0AAV9ELZ7_ACOCL|nr:hypothetical protein QJS10_CPA06g00820 [Acorus calamus]
MSSPRLRAPPSSPTGDHPPVVAHDDGDLTEFLDRLNCVPTLRLPDHRIIPTVQQPPVIDFRAMVAGEISGALREAGLFVVENHGISGELISAASGSVNGRRGFDGEGEGEGEELWWCGGEEMAGEWSEGHLNFRSTMQCLWVETERVATTVLQLLFDNKLVQQPIKAELMTTTTGSVLCLRRHASEGPDTAHDGPARTDLLRTLMRRSNHHHHSLAVHVFQGAVGFSAYSKRGGWASFCVGADADADADADVVVVVTAGDQIQAHKIEEGPLLVHELRIGPALRHPALDDHRDQVESPNRVEPMRHHHRGPPNHHPLEHLLHRPLRLCVHCARRLV